MSLHTPVFPALIISSRGCAFNFVNAQRHFLLVPRKKSNFNSIHVSVSCYSCVSPGDTMPLYWRHSVSAIKNKYITPVDNLSIRGSFAARFLVNRLPLPRLVVIMSVQLITLKSASYIVATNRNAVLLGERNSRSLFSLGESFSTEWRRPTPFTGYNFQRSFSGALAHY